MKSRPEALKYFKIVDNLAPNDLLMKFAKTAPKNVQEAAKSTVFNILGSMPNYALDALLITTNTKLANLLYQMQMTGYMFKNAEYRMSLTRMLKGLPKLPLPAEVNFNDGNISMSIKPVDSEVISGNVKVVSRIMHKIVNHYLLIGKNCIWRYCECRCPRTGAKYILFTSYIIYISLD